MSSGEQLKQTKSRIYFRILTSIVVCGATRWESSPELCQSQRKGRNQGGARESERGLEVSPLQANSINVWCFYSAGRYRCRVL